MHKRYNHGDFAIHYTHCVHNIRVSFEVEKRIIF